MYAYLVRRILATIPVMGVVALAVFMLVHLTPGDPAAVIAGDYASPEDVKRIRATLGLDEPGLAKLIRAGYRLLDLLTFFTVGPKEARAWTVRRGAKAPEAAGAIHTDFQRGFIRAETIAYTDFVACNGETGAKEAGKARLEGKEYVVQDGDILHFRFNN